MSGTTAGRGRLRAVALAAGLAGLALLAGACGGSSSTSPSTAGLLSLQQLTAQALSYAQCMRSHGITNFPDPTVQDNARAKGVSFSGAGIDQNSPQFRSANSTCQRQTGFGRISAAQMQAGMNAMLKFAECMRSHGITNFPDPFENSHQIGFNITGIDQNAPGFKSAQKACRPLLPGGGP
ncbi:MAG TPA: hypothetical protein VIX86_03890 [Streptosporangiaceae bacterium]